MTAEYIGRFEHSLGVAHLASKQALHFKFSQPELGITRTDLKLVEVAGEQHVSHRPKTEHSSYAIHVKLCFISKFSGQPLSWAVAEHAG